MTKISRISLNSLGITKEKYFFYYLKGTLLGIVEIFSVFIIIFLLQGITVYFIIYLLRKKNNLDIERNKKCLQEQEDLEEID